MGPYAHPCVPPNSGGRKSPFEIAANRELVGTVGELPNVPIPDPHLPQTEGLQIGHHSLSISCAIVERPDHLCGDDLVKLLSYFVGSKSVSARLSYPDMMTITALEAITSSSGNNHSLVGAEELVVHFCAKRVSVFRTIGIGHLMFVRSFDSSFVCSTRNQLLEISKTV